MNKSEAFFASIKIVSICILIAYILDVIASIAPVVITAAFFVIALCATYFLFVVAKYYSLITKKKRVQMMSAAMYTTIITPYLISNDMDISAAIAYILFLITVFVILERRGV